MIAIRITRLRRISNAIAVRIEATLVVDIESVVDCRYAAMRELKPCNA